MSACPKAEYEVRRRRWARLLPDADPAPMVRATDMLAAGKAFLAHGKFGDGVLVLTGLYRLAHAGQYDDLRVALLRLFACAGGSTARHAEWLREAVFRRARELAREVPDLRPVHHVLALELALASRSAPDSARGAGFDALAALLPTRAGSSGLLASDADLLTPRAPRRIGRHRDFAEHVAAATADAHGARRARLCRLANRLWQESTQPLFPSLPSSPEA